MKKEIHPEYRTVLFHDVSVDKYYLIPSTLETDQTKEWEDGNTYPYCPLDVSSASHPFYTGQNKIIDTGGRVERFKKRFSKKKSAVKTTPAEESPQEETPLTEEKEDIKASASAEEVTKEAPESAPTDAPQEETSTKEGSDESSNSSEEK